MSKKEKSLHEKVKQFFGRREAAPISFEGLKLETHVLSSDDLKDLSSDNNLNQRLKSLKELYEVVLTKRLEKYAVEAICHNIKDLLGIQSSIETRHIVLQFYTALIYGQLQQMDVMRNYFYRLIVGHNLEEDLAPRFDMLKALSGNGKSINYFEEEIGSFLLNWFPNILSTGKSSEFLNLVTNVIKYHAAYIDDNIIEGFLKNILTHVTRTRPDEDIQECLNILEALLCYSHLPRSVLKTFIFILCVTVNIEKFSPCSWKQMRNLLGTNAGYNCIYTLCIILQERHRHSAIVIRGAIFFIGMALWGTSSVPTLTTPPEAVLPSFLQVLDTGNIIIAYEVILNLQRLVSQQSDELRSTSWNILFTILQKVLLYPELNSRNQPMGSLGRAVHEFITILEENCPEREADTLYEIIKTCTESRNEPSVIRLILHSVEMISPFKPNFISSIQWFLEKFFKNEQRHAIQLKALQKVKEIRLKNNHIWGNDMIDKTICQNMVHVETISDVNIRKEVVKILIEIAESSTSSWFEDILNIIDKMLKRMFDNLPEESSHSGEGDEIYSDVTAAVEGLIRVFKKQLFMLPSNRCPETFIVLINHIQQHYEKLSYFEEIIQIRKLIMNFLLHIRCNKKKQIGVLENGVIEYSVFILCESCEKNILTSTNISSTSTDSATSSTSSALTTLPLHYLNFEKAYQTIVTCLKEEKDWRILEMVLNELPSLLQNKSLVVRGNCPVSSLCYALCNMISDRKSVFPNSLRNAPSHLTRTEVHCHIFPSVASLTSYPSNMEPYMQRMLINCLQSGLVSRSAKICMEGLSLCMLEMRNSMMKLLPTVLLKLSKISATVTVAVPCLEFLSYLIRLPNLYASFVEDQYMSIFAIALPYTNPFKFNQYITALSHHVIAMWFLKCRIPFRKEFAKFITKGLRSNLVIPKEYSSSNTTRSSMDQSSGLTEISTDAIINLHTELMETGLDLMARFTFGMSANIPKRSPVAEFLLENGQKSSWLVGNKIVTITTSGCGTKSFKHGLCERCYTSCREISKSLESDDCASLFLESERSITTNSRATDFSSQRKRHRSAIQRSTTLSTDPLPSTSQAKDDILLHYQRDRDQDSSGRHDPLLFSSNSNVFGGSSTEESEEKKEEKGHHLCSCWCATWAEIHIRRTTGTTSWMMKNQNHLILPSSHPDIPLSVLSSLILPQKESDKDQEVQSLGTGSDCSVTGSDYSETIYEGAIDIVPSQKTAPPMRRTNSSPDMNTGWANLESLQQKKEIVFEDSVEAKFENMKLDEQSSSKKEKASTKRNLKLNLKSANKSKNTSSERRLQFAKESVHSAPIDFHHEADQSNSSGAFRDRGHTISVMSPIRPTGNTAAQPDVSRRSGMNPSFVFLQLFHQDYFGGTDHKPLHIVLNEANVRSLTVLDHIPPYDTHKIGVIYVGPGQVDDEVAILSNVYGSPRFVTFLEGLGDLVKLTDSDPHTTYLGGLDTKGEDGRFTYVWHDDVMQVVFHIATFMPNKESDKNRNEKKKHIANDCVMIVYNASGEEFKQSTIKGHVTNACVVIQPEDFNSNVVKVQHKTKELVDLFGHTESYTVSDASLPLFARQMALHANLASLLISRRQQSSKYTQVSNWLERLRAIKRLRAKVLDEINTKNAEAATDEYGEPTTDPGNYDDFTDYV